MAEGSSARKSEQANRAKALASAYWARTSWKKFTLEGVTDKTSFAEAVRIAGRNRRTTDSVKKLPNG